MTTAVDKYEDYARAALADYEKRGAADRFALVEAVKDLRVERVLDVGCGAGQELLPFLERTGAFCCGVDVAPELGKVTRGVFSGSDAEKAAFAVARGETLPFAAESFDVVLCRIALPYMNNRKTIAEFSRVLRSGGVLLLKIHAPAFYFGMIFERAKTLNPKRIAYPLICLAASLWHGATGKQLEKGFWKGKEIYQTRAFLMKEFAANDLRIERELRDTNPQTPSFYVVKS